MRKIFPRSLPSLPHLRRQASHLRLVIFILLHAFHMAAASRCLIMAWERRQGVFHLLRSVFLFGASARLVELKCCVSQGILPFSWPSSVVFTWPIKYVKPPVFSPHMYNKKSLASIIIAPQGELPKFLPSSFVRNEALSFPAISWNMSFDIKSHPFPLKPWPRRMFILFIYVTADDPAEPWLQSSVVRPLGGTAMSSISRC